MSTSKSVTLLLESALVPAMLVDTGGVLWRDSQVIDLVGHQLRSTYGAAEAPADLWDLRAHHRYGQRFALGFGLSPAVRSLLTSVGQVAGVRWQRWVPGLAWGFDRMHRCRDGCWVWSEQDRWMVTRVVGGEIVRLDPAVTPPTSQGDFDSIIQRIALPAESTDALTTEIATWNSSDWRPADRRQVQWRTVESANATTARPNALASEADNASIA